MSSTRIEACLSVTAMVLLMHGSGALAQAPTGAQQKQQQPESGTGYNVKHKCGTSVPVEGQCRIDVTFRPTSPGDKQAELRIVAGNNQFRSRGLTGVSDDCPGHVVPENRDCTVMATFKPTWRGTDKPGDRTANLVITPGAEGEPRTVTLRGTAQ